MARTTVEAYEQPATHVWRGGPATRGDYPYFLGERVSGLLLPNIAMLEKHGLLQRLPAADDPAVQARVAEILRTRGAAEAAQLTGERDRLAVERGADGAELAAAQARASAIPAIERRIRAAVMREQEIAARLAALEAVQ